MPSPLLSASDLFDMEFAKEDKSAKCKASKQKYETQLVCNTIAMAVIHRLHQWCCQLFWLTIVCVIGCYGELNEDKQKTLQDVRKSISSNSQRRSKTISDLEMQLLRHLTCPQTSIMRPLRRSNAHHKKRHLSRPPSPQLFDICEESDDLE